MRESNAIRFHIITRRFGKRKIPAGRVPEKLFSLRTRTLRHDCVWENTWSSGPLNWLSWSRAFWRRVRFANVIGMVPNKKNEESWIKIDEFVRFCCGIYLQQNQKYLTIRFGKAEDFQGFSTAPVVTAVLPSANYYSSRGRPTLCILAII